MDKSFRILNLLISVFIQKHLSENEKTVFEFMLSKNPDLESAKKLFENFDISSASDNKILLFSNFVKTHPKLGLDKFLPAKTSELKEFYMRRRLELFVHLDKVAGEFNAQGVRPMLVKGALMSFLNPDLLRTMGDVDIIVPADKFDYSKEIAQKLNYEYAKEPHSFDFHEKGSEKGVVDVHKYIYMDTKCEMNLNQSLWQRAKEITFLDREFCIPCDEDIIFISLVNLARNLRNNTSFSNILYSFFDCKHILENASDFNWDTVLENAAVTKTLPQLYFSLYFIRNLMPEIFPEKLFDIKEKERKQLKEYCLKVYFNRIFIDGMRQQNKSINWTDAVTGKVELKDYLKLKSKYFLMKRVVNYPSVIEKIIGGNI